MKTFYMKNAYVILDTLEKLGFKIKTYKGFLGESYIAERKNAITLQSIETKYVLIEAYKPNAYEVVFTSDKKVYENHYYSMIDMLQEYEYALYCKELERKGLTLV